MSDAARPRLNAAISAKPERRSAHRYRAEQDHQALGDGEDPAGEGERDQPAAGERSIRVRVVVSVPPMLAERVDPRHEQDGAQPERDEAGRESQPRIDTLRIHEPFRGEHEQTEGEHRRGVHHGHREPDPGRVSERAARAQEGHADQRLP